MDSKNESQNKPSSNETSKVRGIEMKSSNLIHIKPGKQIIQINPGISGEGQTVAFRLGNIPCSPLPPPKKTTTPQRSSEILNLTPSLSVTSPSFSTTSLSSGKNVSTPQSTTFSSPSSTPTLPPNATVTPNSVVGLIDSSPPELKQVNPNEMSTALNGRFIVTRMSKDTFGSRPPVLDVSSPGTTEDETFSGINSPLQSPGDSQSTDEIVSETQSEPTKRHPKWTSEDDKSLRAAVLLQGGRNWKEIAKMMDNKYTETQCLNRYKKVLNPNVIKGPWTPEEDQRLIQLVKTHGAKKWSVIASKMSGRISKQCRERWVNALNPEINKGPWTEEEDFIIEKAHEQFGNKWSRIVAVLKKHGYVRTDNGVKNHWNSTMRRERERKKDGDEESIKKRKYRKSTTGTSAEIGKTPKKRKYASVITDTTAESDEVLLQQRRTQQATLNGLLVPNIPYRGDDYQSIYLDPTLSSIIPDRFHEVENTPLFPSEILPSVLKPNPRKRIRQTAANKPSKRRKFVAENNDDSSSSDIDDQPVSRCLDFSQPRSQSEEPCSPSNVGSEYQDYEITNSPHGVMYIDVSSPARCEQPTDLSEITPNSHSNNSTMSHLNSFVNAPITRSIRSPFTTSQHSLLSTMSFPITHPVFSLATRLLHREGVKL